MKNPNLKMLSKRLKLKLRFPLNKKIRMWKLIQKLNNLINLKFLNKIKPHKNRKRLNKKKLSRKRLNKKKLNKKRLNNKKLSKKILSNKRKFK